MSSASVQSKTPSPQGPGALFRAVAIAGIAALVVWAVWWAYSLYNHELWAAKYTWIHVPVFGADFYSQPALAARELSDGIDPYASRGHLFHYPPLVIWSFLWTVPLKPGVALRIWIGVCMVLVVLGTWLAVRVRRKLPVGQIPLSAALAAVLFSFPVIFQLERSNFDLLTLAAMLVAFWLFQRNGKTAEFLAGCVLAVGPWVKLYPGIMVIGLLAARRWRATIGFAVAGVLIFLAAPVPTIHSFEVLQIAVTRIKWATAIDPLAPWAHSFSVAWVKLTQAAAGTPLAKPMAAIPADAAAGALVMSLAAWVSFRVYRQRAGSTLLYPLLLWLNAAGSCVGAIANDYSLVFLPIAIIAVFSSKDGWFVRIAMALLLIWWQPIDLHLTGGPFLFIKLLGLIATGVCIVKRADELAAISVTERRGVSGDASSDVVSEGAIANPPERAVLSP